MVDEVFVEAGEGGEAGVDGGGGGGVWAFYGGAEGGLEPGVVVGWGMEEVDVVELGLLEDGFEVAAELFGGPVEVFLDEGYQGVEVVGAEGVGEFEGVVVLHEWSIF